METSNEAVAVDATDNVATLPGRPFRRCKSKPGTAAVSMNEWAPATFARPPKGWLVETTNVAREARDGEVPAPSVQRN
jgi:hypothetical protein